MTDLSALLNGDLPNLVEQTLESLVVVESKKYGAGAGTIWHKDGLIVTNNHVLGEYVPKVHLNDGRQFDAEVIGIDEDADLAVLQIEGNNLPALTNLDLGKVRIGEIAFAVGHPWGQRNSVTAGVISQISTIQTKSGRKFPVIRTDSRLAPGNSGGPLINAAGEVIGINTMIVGGDQGIAIPSSVAEELIQEMRSNQANNVQPDQRGARV